ncbi:MAG: hypothetical protein ABIP96_00830 [Patescibacteria group bacterium]
MIALTPRLKLIVSTALALVVGFLVGTFVLTVPSPRVIGFDNTAAGVTIHGITARGASVMAFTEEGVLIDAVHASESGQFTFEGIGAGYGSTVIVLRSLNQGWRASPPKRVDLAGILGSEVSSTSTIPTAPSDLDLPPLAIPPTSTKPKVDTASSTPSYEVETISAIASIASASLAPKANQTVTVTVKDQKGKFLTGVNVAVVAHYPTEDVTYTAIGDGTYRIKFKVPENIGTGTNILLDIKATYESFASTAKASFTVK